MFRRFLLTAAVAVASVIAAPAVSRADFSVSLSDGTNSVTFEIVTAAGSTNGNIYGASGTGTFSGTASSLDGATVLSIFGGASISGLTIKIDSVSSTDLNFSNSSTSGITFEGSTILSSVTATNSPGNSAYAQLNLDNTQVSPLQSSSGAASSNLSMTVAENGFTAPANIQSYVYNSTSGSAAGGPPLSVGTITGTSFYSASNTLPGTSPGNESASVSYSGGTGGGTNTSGTFTPISGGYTIGASISINGFTSGNLDVNEFADLYPENNPPNPVPGPSGLIVVASMLPFFSVGMLRRRLIGKATPIVA